MAVTQEEMTRCRGSLIRREHLKSEFWVSSFGEVVLPVDALAIPWLSAVV